MTHQRLPISPEDEAYAQYAFAVAMQQEHVPISPEMVRVFRSEQGLVMCMTDDPDRIRRAATPFAWGAFRGDANGGQVSISQFFNPEDGHWQQPVHPNRDFDGPIPFTTK